MTGQHNRKHQYWQLTTSKQVPTPWKSIHKSALHWQSFWKEKRWTLFRTLHEARAGKLEEACEKVWPADGRWVGNGHCQVAFSTLEQWKCMNCHEPLNSGRNVSDRTIQCTRKNFWWPAFWSPESQSPAVRSEIEKFLEARQSDSNPNAMDMGILNGQKGVCCICGQRGHWAAECPKTWQGLSGRQWWWWQGTG